MANTYLQEYLEELEAADEKERTVIMKQEEWDANFELEEVDEECEVDASEGQRIRYRVVAYNQELIIPLGCYDDFADACARFDELQEAVDSNIYEIVEVERVVLSPLGEVMDIRMEYRAVSEEFMDSEAQVDEVVQ